MEIRGKIHCFFEQSGTFKNEFRKLGYEAFDYDIQNNFEETDFVMDLFREIEKGYNSEPSIFDTITKDDLTLSFFPCVYFCAMSQIAFYYANANYKGMTYRERTDAILQRSKNREQFFRFAVEMIGICYERGIRIIMENPWNEQTFLKSNFVMPPSYVDKDRSRRGDFFKKPTAYWFVNCEPEDGFTSQQTHKNKLLTHDTFSGSGKAGICSEKRSMISPDYARNFICDQILGFKQKRPLLQLSLF